MGTDARGRRPAPVTALLVVGTLLLVAAVVLGVLDARAGGRTDDRAAAVAAARAHLVDLGAASADPAARSRAVEGATGPWREQVAGAAATGSTSTVVRAIGLEDLDDDTASALAVGLVGGDGGARTFRASVALSRVDGRWLVAGVGELP